MCNNSVISVSCSYLTSSFDLVNVTRIDPTLEFYFPKIWKDVSKYLSYENKISASQLENFKKKKETVS